MRQWPLLIVLIGVAAGLGVAVLGADRWRLGCLIIGAFLGGFLFSLLTGRETPFAWTIGSFIVAVIGAGVLLVILHLDRRARSDPLP